MRPWGEWSAIVLVYILIGLVLYHIGMTLAAAARSWFNFGTLDEDDEEWNPFNIRITE